MSVPEPDREHLERLVRSCLGAPISRFLRCGIAIPEPGRATVTIPFHADLTQNSQLLHGAVFFEAADTAGFVAANSVEATYSVLTVRCDIHFLRPVRQAAIRAEAEVLHRGRQGIVARSEAYDEADRLVALGQGTYAISRIPLAEVPGYLDGPEG